MSLTAQSIQTASSTFDAKSRIASPLIPNVNSIVNFVDITRPHVNKPDYDNDVLAPLHAAQEKAAEEAARLAEMALEQQQEAEREQEAAREAEAAQRARTQVTVQVGVQDPKLYIYMHESGNNPGAINPSSGACGLGQALPCSRLPCSMSDYACQDAWFTQYCLERYGGWPQAMAFWQAHSWW